MAFCTSCGSKVNDGAAFCGNCGAPIGANKAETTKTTSSSTYGTYNSYPSTKNQSTKDQNSQNTYNYQESAGTKAQPKSTSQAGNDNTLMGVLCYLGILVLVPILAAKENAFARFHANQGLILLIGEFAVSIISYLIPRVLPYNGLFYLIYAVIMYGGGLILFVLSIIGIMNVVKGETKELPYIGKYKILK